MSAHEFAQGRSTKPALSNQRYGATTAHDDEEGPRQSGSSGLQRDLSARQVQMIAIAGTIGTGLFLGTGRSLAQGGPASMLICYGVIGFIVYVTLLLLGEMATQYPVAGSFNAYTSRFFSPSYGFALGWNYWFNDAVSVASDLTAAQLVLQFWTISNPWIISVVFWVFLVSVNAVHVRAYGELEYWLSSLKVVTVILFIIVGVFVNVGFNTEQQVIGLANWKIRGAPFVGGFGGFARVFVTASFAFGGTESLGITAGETKNPSKNMPRVVNLVFWRIVTFYVLTVLLIGLNVPWDYPNLSNRSATTSPFTIVFKLAGSRVAASFMNTVVLTSVLSAGNHALFAGTRVLYGLSVTSPPQAPKVFSWTTSGGIPLPALLLTSSVSALCLLSSFIGSGALWGWLQNIVGVSNQIAWLSIGLSSWRFRKAWLAQGRAREELKFTASWTWPWGPAFVIISVFGLIIVQGWSSVIPKFSILDFISFYVEVPVMIAMTVIWLIASRIRGKRRAHYPAESSPETQGLLAHSPAGSRLWDLVDVETVDLLRDEYDEPAATPKASHNNRDSYMTTTTTTSATTDTTTSTASSSTFTGSSYTGTNTSGDLSSLRTYDRRSSSTYSSQSEIVELEQMIFRFKEQLDAHKRRADTEERRANEAEKRLQEYAEHLTKVNKARLLAQQEAAKANEELRLYKLQLEYAQREINRAQSVLDDVEKQRHVAEKEATEAKAFARKLKEELMIDNARREGRRQGLQEGLDRGRHLILQETEPTITAAAQRRLSSLDQESFMNESFGSSSDDDRSISTESHVTLQADRRPRERRQSNPPPPASVAGSSPPLPIPEPRSAAPRAQSIIYEQRPASRAPSMTHEQRPPSRAPSAIYEQRPTSRAPSVIHERPPSRAPTVVREPSPAPRAPSTVQEYHSRAPSVASPPPKSPQIRSGSVQGYFSSIPPPDNYIPSLEQDGTIRLPPPSGFHKPPHTPERHPSPSLPLEPHPVLYRHSSPESASTTLSHIDLLKDPYNGQVAVSPGLSAIEEVSSQVISPWTPAAQDLRHQPSVIGSATGKGFGSGAGSPYTNHNDGSQVGGHHSRTRSTSSFVPSIHERPPSVASRLSKKGGSAQDTPPHINVQPPSRPVSDGVRSLSKSEQLSPLSSDSVPLPSFAPSPAASSSAKPILMPGNMFDTKDYSIPPSPLESVNARDDDAVSSRISGDEDFFTTPPPAVKQTKRLSNAGSALSGVSARTSKSKASRNR